MPSVKTSGSKKQLLLHRIAVGDGPRDRHLAKINHFSIMRPCLRRVLSLVAGRSKLCLEMKCHRAFDQALLQIFRQIVRRFFFSLFLAQMHDLFGRDDVAKGLFSAGRIDKNQRVDAVILLVSVTVRGA